MSGLVGNSRRHVLSCHGSSKKDSSFTSNENIHEEEDGSYNEVSANKVS